MHKIRKKTIVVGCEKSTCPDREGAVRMLCSVSFVKIKSTWNNNNNKQAQKYLMGESQLLHNIFTFVFFSSI